VKSAVPMSRIDQPRGDERSGLIREVQYRLSVPNDIEWRSSTSAIGRPRIGVYAIVAVPRGSSE